VLPAKRPREQATELVGSMLLAATVAAVAALLTLAWYGNGSGPTAALASDREVYVWLAITGTLGAWAVLIPAKLWEGRHGDPVLRRFVGLSAGLVTGLAAWSMADWLIVDLSNFLKLPHLVATPQGTHNVSGQPELLGYLAYFGFTFLLVRWWKQSDPLRKSRLSVWATVMAIGWSTAVSMVWSFPQPWGLITVATISLAVQLSSPWYDPAQARVPAGQVPAQSHDVTA
jgi:hypothetical protein